MASYLPDGVEDSLETRLNKATNPLQVEENWEYIVGFCDLINKDIDGPQLAVRLLVHKIQSPQEKESLFALTTLEACVRNCGQRFQQEIGKFRFINEIIKIVSPKYLGSQRTVRVKNRCIALLYFWSQILTDEPKIKEAYQMLKKQGIVKEDPDIYHVPSLGSQQSCGNLPHAPPPPPPAAAAVLPATPASQKNSIFEDEDKSKLLSRLLKSKNTEDLQAANRLIKNMVKQDAERTEKVTRRTQQLETVSNNVKLLNEMLQNHQPGNSTESDREIMKELSENIEKQRPALFRLASDSDERDSTGIAEILRANDEVIQVLSLYDSLINKSDVGNLLTIEDASGPLNALSSKSNPSNDASTKSATKDLNNLNLLLSSHSTTSNINDQSHSLLDEQLLSLGLTSEDRSSNDNLQRHPPSSSVKVSGIEELSDIFSSSSSSSSAQNSIIPINSTSLGDAFQQTTPNISNFLLDTSHYNSVLPTYPSSSANILKPLTTTTSAASTSGAAATTASSVGLGSLDELSKSLLLQTLSSSGLEPHRPASQPTKVTLNQMGKPSQITNNNGTMDAIKTLKSLDDIFVSLDAIRPGSKPSMTIYSKCNISIIFHFALDRPRSDVQVIAVTSTSTSRSPVKELSIFVTPVAEQEKLVQVKMQAASSSMLPAYNPIFSPPAATQVVLVSCPDTEINVRLKVTISYVIEDSVTRFTEEVSL